MVYKSSSGSGGGGGGTVTITGTPASGNLTKFSGATSITNGDLTGAITTSGATATSLGSFSSANLASALTDETGSGLAVFGTSPTLSNPVVGTQSTSDNSTKAASTAYVTTAVANAVAGINPAVAVQAATTQASDTSALTYNNGVSGVGATLTGANNTALTVDGYTFTAIGQRLLVKNDTQSPSGAFNGVYSVTQVQAALLPLILTRALDYNSPSDINNTGAIPVINGTVNVDTSWIITSSVTTVGTDPLTYIQFTKNPATLLTTTLTSAHILVGNGSNIATDVAVSGDLTTTNAGAFTVAKINSTTVSGTTGSGNVVFSTSPTISSPSIAALANLTSDGFILTSGGVGTLGVSTALPTGSTATTPTIHDNSGKVSTTQWVITEITTLKTRTIGFSSYAPTTGQQGAYYVFPVAGTITGWSIVADAGTATVQTWKIASGTTAPSSGNSISTSGVQLSTGTAIISSSVGDFTTVAVSANDIFAFNLSAVSGVTRITFELQITVT